MASENIHILPLKRVYLFDICYKEVLQRRIKIDVCCLPSVLYLKPSLHSMSRMDLPSMLPALDLIVMYN